MQTYFSDEDWDLKPTGSNDLSENILLNNSVHGYH